MKFFKTIYLFLLFITTPTNSFIPCQENYREELVKKSSHSIQFSKAPSWVEEIEYDSENYEENITWPGYASLLVDSQVNLDEKIYYNRIVQKILSKAALSDASRISIPFNPQNEELIVHSLKIIRDEKVIDKLLTAKRQIFYPCSGNITDLVFYLDNLHVGDILEYSFSQKLKKSHTNQLRGDTFVLKQYGLYKKIAYSCLIGKDKPLSWKTHLFEQDPVCTLNGSYKKYFWEINYSNIDFLTPSDFPKVSPSQKIRVPSISVSTTTWNEIAKYCAGLLNEKTHFSSSPPQNIVELVQQLQSLYSNVEDQILAAIRLVSDDIYYASIPDEEKEHLITPYSPEEILQKHYGDCKDKSCLLIAILKLLDVEAYPVLVNTQTTYEVKNELPNPFFNHLILTIEYNGKSYFIDPTRSLLGGTLDTYQIPDFGYGLVLKEDSEDLTPITRNFLSKIDSASTFSLQDIDGTWEHKIQFSHGSADLLRYILVPESTNKKSKDLLTSLHNLYPEAKGVYLSPLQIEDDRQANVITNKFAISFENFGQKTATGTLFNFNPFLNHIGDNETEALLKNKNISKPLSLENYRKFVEEQHRTLDIYCDKSSIVEEKKISYTDENMSYTFTVEKICDTHIRVVLYQKFFKTFIEVDHLPQFYKKLEEFKNHLSLTIEIPD